MKKALLLALISSTIATQALAQQQRSGRDAEERACGRDVSRFCKAVIDQGDLTILACLQQNRTKISTPCQKVLRDNGV